MRPAAHMLTQRGVALVLVLWALVLLMVIAGSFAYSMRTEAVLTQNLVATAQARARADGAAYLGIFELLKPMTDATKWKPDGKIHAWEAGEAKIRVVVTDESGKIDLNAASDALLKGLFQSAGLGEEDSTALLDAVLDWRDADDLRRPNGAEIADYVAAGSKYAPSNAPFKTLEELQQVKGMSPALYRKIHGALTIFSGQPGINPAFAPRQALLAIPGVEAAQVDAYIAQRQEYIDSDQPPPPFPFASGFASAGSGSAYFLRVEVKLRNGGGFVREAVVRMAQDRKRPFQILSWKEGDAVEQWLEPRVMDVSK
ncbi:MAG: type II secretion system protein GspK [Sulfuricella sp.]|nr:type II secretion system protein GspK [Sulfuricella sp.]